MGFPTSRPALITRRRDAQNVAVLAAQTLAWATSLLVVSQPQPDWLVILVAAGFCLFMQGVFSLMHECFHGHGHSNSRVNYLMGWWATTLFGASTTLICINHMGHHVRNRTRAERVDLVEADESRAQKTAAYYLAVLGGIWLAAFVGSVLLALLPRPMVVRLLAATKQDAGQDSRRPGAAGGSLATQGSHNTYAAAFADFTLADVQRIRTEVLASAAAWLLAGWALGVTWQGLALLYAAFALSWSSLQWIYHVRTPLDVVEGAYNLRAPRLVRGALLSFNYNLTHHRRPSLRWQELQGATDLAETRPFFRTWLAILLPPRPMPEDRRVVKSYY